MKYLTSIFLIISILGNIYLIYKIINISITHNYMMETSKLLKINSEFSLEIIKFTLLGKSKEYVKQMSQSLGKTNLIKEEENSLVIENFEFKFLEQKVISISLHN